jgi:hypothetical protein
MNYQFATMVNILKPKSIARIAFHLFAIYILFSASLLSYDIKKNDSGSATIRNLGFRIRGSLIIPSHNNSHGTHLGIAFKKYGKAGLNLQQEISFWSTSSYTGIELSIISLAYNVVMNQYSIEPFVIPLQIDLLSESGPISFSYGVSITYRKLPPQIIFIQLRSKYTMGIPFKQGAHSLTIPIIIGVGVEYSLLK